MEHITLQPGKGINENGVVLCDYVLIAYLEKLCNPYGKGASARIQPIEKITTG